MLLGFWNQSKFKVRYTTWSLYCVFNPPSPNLEIHLIRCADVHSCVSSYSSCFIDYLCFNNACFPCWPIPFFPFFFFSLSPSFFGFLFLPFLCVWSEFAINTVPQSQRALRLFDWVRFPWGNCNFHQTAFSAGAQYYSITTAGNMKNTLVNRCLGSLKTMQIGENNWNSFLIWFSLLSLQVADMVLCLKHN